MNKPNLEPWEKDTMYGAFVTLKWNISVLWGKFLCAFGIRDWRQFGYAGNKVYLICHREGCTKGKWVRR